MNPKVISHLIQWLYSHSKGEQSLSDFKVIGVTLELSTIVTYLRKQNSCKVNIYKMKNYRCKDPFLTDE